MSPEERTVVRQAINDAKRGWVQRQGGYPAVEDDALKQEYDINRRCNGGHKTRAELLERIHQLELMYRRQKNTNTTLRRNRDMWRHRALAAIDRPSNV